MIFTKVIKKRLRFLVFICVFIFLVGVDHATKHYFHTQTFFWAKDYKYKVEGDKRYLIPNNTKKTISNFLLKKNEVVSKRYLLPEEEQAYIKETIIVSDFWSFFYVRNHNIGFSLLSSLDNFVNSKTKIKILVAIQSFAICFILFYFIFTLKMRYIWSFAFIFSGGVGNVSERIIRGYVVDFVKWEFPYLPIQIFNPWPIFNVADIWVSIGGVILLITFFYESKTAKEFVIDNLYDEGEVPTYFN